MIIANQGMPAARTDINNALQALASTSVGNAAPATIYTGQLWIDNNSPSATIWTLSMYDGTDSILAGYFNTTTNVFGVTDMWDADFDTGIQVEEGADDDVLRFDVAGSQVAQMSGTALFWGDTINTKNTGGATFNQAGLADEIISLKSSDVAHGLTSVSETDTFAAFQKRNSAEGGLQIFSVCEDAAVTIATAINSYGGTASTTKSTAGNSLIELYVAEHNGSNAQADITADGNVFGIAIRKSSGTVTVWIIDEDGDFHYDGADGGAFDTIDDMLPIRAAQRVMAKKPKELLRMEFDHAIYNDLELAEEWGLIGRVPESDPKGSRGLINGAQLNRFFMGAHVQSYNRELLLMELLEEDTPGITARMQVKLTDAQMPQLPI